MNSRFHLLKQTFPLPAKFTFPFCYTPHPLCLSAAHELQRYIDDSGLLALENGGGKMFGVLVVKDVCGTLGFLAAYSGLIAGRNDWSYFVPPVFDAQSPGGYFKMREAQITALGRDIAVLENDAAYADDKATRNALAVEASTAVDSYRKVMAAAKDRRDACRKSILTSEENEALRRESQFMKAELRRIRKRYDARLDEITRRISTHEKKIKCLRQRRRDMSDGLQEWLFRRYEMLDACGHRRTLLSIFADTPQRVPPAGTGDCCAPKLLQYAFLHGLKPVCMAEFWWGRPPKNELRRHGHFYPACSGKCKPVLGHMLQGLDVDSDPLSAVADMVLKIVYEDDSIVVVDKPGGMLSVPGKNGCSSVVSLMRDYIPDAEGPLVVHRLDMDTSGLMLVAKTIDVYRILQRQFADRSVKKRYTAILDGIPSVSPSGTVELPLRPDPLDRPRQTVDRSAGKPAVIRYEVVSSRDGMTRVNLYPLTGRTHQLRVHCAHPDGLGCPILGDNLYGHRAGRLFLHASEISFTHPISGVAMRFESMDTF